MNLDKINQSQIRKQSQNILKKSRISDCVEKLLMGKKNQFISDMINFGDSVVVGLSGGADSVALTHFLVRISKKFGLKVTACHINHGIRGNEADADQEFVRIYCKNLKIDLLEKKVNLLELSKKRKISIEELGRNVRYDFFDECSKKFGAKIATAHNLNDNAETVILNLVRGSGLKGLSGIPVQRGNIIRPFINFSRQDIEQYCEENELSFVTDSTNLSVDYSRNLIRHKIIPVVSQINSNFASTIKRNCDIILRDELYLSQIAQDIIKNIFDQNGYSIKKLEKYPENIKTRVLKQILGINQLSYSYKKIEVLLDFVFDSRHQKMMLDHTKYICKNNGYFNICDINRNQTSQIPKISLNLFSSVARKYIDYNIIDSTEIKEKIEKDKSILKCCVDYDKIVGNLVLRNKEGGDKVKLAYRKCSKSLKKLFNEEKISPEDRNKILVISDDLGVIWVQNFGADQRVNVTPDTRNILFLN